MSSIPARAESCSEKGVPSGKGPDVNPGSFLLWERGLRLVRFFVSSFFRPRVLSGVSGQPGAVRSPACLFSSACPDSHLSDLACLIYFTCLACPISPACPVFSVTRLVGVAGLPEAPTGLSFSPVRCLACPVCPNSPSCPVFSAYLHFVGAVLLFIFHIFPLCVFLGYRIIFLDELPEMCYNDTIIILNLN